MEHLPARPFLIGVAGGSSSGKTTVAERLAELAGTAHLALIKLDSYYVDLSDRPWRAQAFDYDHPDAFDWPLLNDHLAALAAGARCRCRSTTTCSTTAAGTSSVVQPAPIVVVEGILVLWEPTLRERFDLKVFVDTDADMRLIRRLRRDAAERGRSAESVIEQYLATVRPPTSSSSSRRSATPTSSSRTAASTGRRSTSCWPGRAARPLVRLAHVATIHTVAARCSPAAPTVHRCQNSWYEKTPGRSVGQLREKPSAPIVYTRPPNRAAPAAATSPAPRSAGTSARPAHPLAMYMPAAIGSPRRQPTDLIVAPVSAAAQTEHQREHGRPRREQRQAQRREGAGDHDEDHGVVGAAPDPPPVQSVDPAVVRRRCDEHRRRVRRRRR